MTARVLVAELVAGLALLAVVAALDMAVLALVGLAYVVPASVFVAWVLGWRGRPRSTRRELLGLGVPWVGSVVLWVWLLEPVSGHSLDAVLPAAVAATPCFLVWQTAALGVWLLLGARPGTSRTA